MTKWQFVAHFAFSEHKKTDAWTTKRPRICINVGKITFSEEYSSDSNKKPCIYIIKYDGNDYDYCRLCQII